MDELSFECYVSCIMVETRTTTLFLLFPLVHTATQIMYLKFRSWVLKRMAHYRIQMTAPSHGNVSSLEIGGKRRGRQGSSVRYR